MAGDAVIEKAIDHRSETVTSNMSRGGNKDGEDISGVGMIPRDPKGGEPPSTRNLQDLVPDCVDPVFEAKAAMINHAINEIGMGRHQWILFIVCGFGYVADQLVQTAVADALPQVGQEFNPTYPAFLSLASIVGLVAGKSSKCIQISK